MVRRGEKIPAIIRINEQLSERTACNDCGRWQEPGLTECEICGGTRLEVRSRAITLTLTLSSRASPVVRPTRGHLRQTRCGPMTDSPEAVRT